MSEQPCEFCGGVVDILVQIMEYSVWSEPGRRGDSEVDCLGYVGKEMECPLGQRSGFIICQRERHARQALGPVIAHPSLPLDVASRNVESVEYPRDLVEEFDACVFRRRTSELGGPRKRVDFAVEGHSCEMVHELALELVSKAAQVMRRIKVVTEKPCFEKLVGPSSPEQESVPRPAGAPSIAPGKQRKHVLLAPDPVGGKDEVQLAGHDHLGECAVDVRS